MLSVLLPVLETFGTYRVYQIEVIRKEDIGLFWKVYNNLVPFVITVLQIYAGSILVSSVLKIKRYFNENNL